MAHLVETMAYAGQTPWHGLGNRVSPDISIEEMLKEAGLDWGVNKEKIYAQIQGLGLKEIKDHYALIRDKDNSILDVVGADYKPLQNKDAFEFFRSFLAAGDMKLDTAGSLKNGKAVWGLASLENDIILKANGRDDITKAYLLVSTGHETGKAFTIKLTTVRVVCNNTLTLSLNMRENLPVFRMTHRNEFNEGMREYAKALITNSHTALAEYGMNAKKLIEMDMSFDKATPLLASIYQEDEFKKDPETKDLIFKWDDTANSTMKRIREAYNIQPGKVGRTAFDVLNAVTFFNTHQQGRSQDNRLANSWFGQSATKNQAVLNGLLKLAA
jgi:phage/plasmid-like protein (TIGR03299 family)